jgi:hypothetical protein
MAWLIKCRDPSCSRATRARNIPDLIENHTDPEGVWFLCACGERGYVERSHKQQEGGTWDPVYHGVIALGDPGFIYQPYAFLIGDAGERVPNQVQFAYYKDLRGSGGTLKSGHGPGGTPVLRITQVGDLVRRLEGLRL